MQSRMTCATCAHCNRRRSATIPALHGILRIISRIAPPEYPPNRSRHQRHPHPADEYPPKHTRSSHNRQPNSRTARPAPSSPDSSASTGQYDPQSPDAWKTSEKNLPQRTDSQSSSQQPTAYRQSSASASSQRRSRSYSMRRERFRIFRKYGTIFVGIIFSRTRNRHLNKRSGNRRKNRAQQHTQQSKTIRR